jgi:hypothetical protein
MSFCTKPTVAAKDRRGAADEGDKGKRIGCILEDRRHARDQEHTGCHHGGRMDQRGHRRRAFHRIRQPGVQKELGRLAHRAHEQEQADGRQRVHFHPEEIERGVGVLAGAFEDHVELGGVEQDEGAEYTQKIAEIADAVDDEGLHRCGVGRCLFVPEADQQVGGDAHAFPAKEHLQQVIGGDQHQHGEGEQRQIREEACAVLVMAHVADGIEVNERRDRVHHHQHHRCQRIEAERPIDGKVARRNPVQHLHALMTVNVTESGFNENDPGEHGSQRHKACGDDLHRAMAQQPTEQAGYQKADKRQKDNSGQHGRISLSSC